MSRPSLPHWPDRWQATLGWQPSTTQQSQFQHLYHLVLASNQHLNLTRITTPEDFWEKHLWDSLRGIQAYLIKDPENSEESRTSTDIPEKATPSPLPSKPTSLPHPGTATSMLQVLDIGTGAGFPGLPVAIVRPDWHLTLLDSTRKKIVAVAAMVDALGLPHVQTLADRAEHLSSQAHHKHRYDLILLRAVATAHQCAHYALPLLKPKGVAILYRGQWQPDDTEALAKQVADLGGVVAATDWFSTPLTQGQRCCIHLRHQPSQ